MIHVQITWIELFNYILYIELELPEFPVREGRIGNLVYWSCHEILGISSSYERAREERESQQEDVCTTLYRERERERERES